MRAQFTNRVRIVAVLVVIVGLVLIGRLYDLQVIKGSSFRDQAEGQYAIESSNHFDRGSIFFTDKNGNYISAATLGSGFTLALVPYELSNEGIDPSSVYSALSEHVEIDSTSFFEKAAKKDDPYEELFRRLSLDEGYALIEKNIPGVRLYRERWRFYPGDDTAAQTIGFMGFGTGDTLHGQYGLERYYDDVLTKPNTGLYVNFFADVFANIRTKLFTSRTQPGADVVTAIEPTVQSFFEDVLTRYQNEWQASEVGVIVLDPKTGEVLALAAYPSFNPNDLSTADANAFSNPLIEDVYEFGSIVKPLTIAAGIDAGVITPDTTYVDQGFAVYDGSRISNFDGKGRGKVSMQEVLNQSLNTGVAFTVEKLGTETFREYFDAFGIREETGVDLPSEGTPLVDNLDSPRTIEYVTASFGQGIAVTPIAMARSLGTLANGGIVPAPHIATKLRYPGGFEKEVGWSPERRAISKQSAETTTRMLVEVRDTPLRGGTVKIPELSVAAKTGTAQIARVDERGYYDDRCLHSFFGYFRAYEARFLVFFYSVAPQGARYASETWTNPFMESVRFLMTYYDVPPDRPTTHQ